MKLTIINHGNCYRYDNEELYYKQEYYDYIYKYLEFNKVINYTNIYMDNEEDLNYFKNLINTDKDIVINKYLKYNWGRGVFKIWVFYKDKEELKSVVNRIINIRLIRGE